MRDWCECLTPLASDDLLGVLDALFELVTERRFGADHDQREVAQFVQKVAKGSVRVGGSGGTRLAPAGRMALSTHRRAALSAPGMGFLRRGERGALATAATALYAGGLVVVTRRGLLQRSRSPMRGGVEPLAAAVYAAMPAPTRFRALSGRSRVPGAVSTLVHELSRAGLVLGQTRRPPDDYPGERDYSSGTGIL